MKVLKQICCGRFEKVNIPAGGGDCDSVDIRHVYSICHQGLKPSFICWKAPGICCNLFQKKRKEKGKKAAHENLKKKIGISRHQRRTGATFCMKQPNPLPLSPASTRSCEL